MSVLEKATERIVEHVNLEGERRAIGEAIVGKFGKLELKVNSQAAWFFTEKEIKPTFACFPSLPESLPSHRRHWLLFVVAYPFACFCLEQIQ